MIITNRIKLDLQKPGTAPTIHAVQNDSYSRNLKITLFSNHRPFVFPENGTVVIRYKKSDGKGGEYDTLPDGSVAWRAERNMLTVALAPQVLTTPGSVFLSVTLLAEGTQLSIFPIRLCVEPIAAVKSATSEDYFYITGLLTAPVSGKTGQCFRISSVSDSGRITALESVDPDTLFGDSVSREVALALDAAKASGEFNGEKPQKGVDYWTDADKEAIVQDVLAALGESILGRVDEENNIILTGELENGTYTLKYEDAEGNLTEIGSITIAGEIPIIWNVGTINKTDGTVDTTSTNYSHSEPIAVDSSKSYTLHLTDVPVSVKVCYYDSDGNFLSVTAEDLWAGYSGEQAIHIPMMDDAAFIRFRCFHNSNPAILGGLTHTEALQERATLIEGDT